ncbi:hypothetical protein G5B39_05060 [Rhodobacteraceae bacterium SC52]|nr:hypothetical protein G5B39_05060 [Rhodobacteraceae bacterium SC52]
MALLRSTDFRNLPSEPKARWLGLRDLVESRLRDVEDMRNGNAIEDIIEYARVLSTAAKELEVGDLNPLHASYSQDEYQQFRGEVAGLATTLSLQVSETFSVISVALERPTKERIFSQIERLRSAVDQSDLDDRAKRRAHAKLDELHKEILAPRTDFAKVLSVLAYISGGIGGATSFLAAAPGAIETVTALIGAEKEAEEVKLLEVSAPLKAIPDFRSGSIDDDEAPF